MRAGGSSRGRLVRTTKGRPQGAASSLLERAITIRIVTTTECPILAETTGLWRWEAFFSKDGLSLDEVLLKERDCANDLGVMPSVLVLLKQDEPIGMVALCENDIEGRPELNPWLAGMYVAPGHRGAGHARRLIGELEDYARANGIGRLSLYTAVAVGLYLKCGWHPTEAFERSGRTFSIMQKQL